MSQRLLLIFVAVALLPMLPLVLLEYPVAELVEKLFRMLFNR